MSGLMKFGAYQKARQLFDWVVVQKDPRTWRLVSQQIASADSICANMEEGYGRLGRAEYVRFLDFSRGSARETQGRYERMKPWLAEEVIRQRVTLLNEIIAILTRTIETLRREQFQSRASSGTLHEASAQYGVLSAECRATEALDMSSLDTRHPLSPTSSHSTPDTQP